MINIPKTAFAVIIILLVILAIILAYRATHSTSRFSFEDAFLDENGKTSHARIAYFVALMVSTWAFTYMTMEDKLTEWFMTIYVGAWVIGGVANKFIEKQ